MPRGKTGRHAAPARESELALYIIHMDVQDIQDNTFRVLFLQQIA